MTQPRFADVLRSERVVAVVRRNSAEPGELVAIAEALSEAGVRLIEFPLTNARALDALQLAARAAPGLMLGVGTVRTLSEVSAAAEAGAAFVVSPHFDADIVSAARARGMGTLPGALSPTEISSALDSGADGVKIFPAGPLGAGYIAALLGPFPDAVFVPTGGISVAAAPHYLAAGATAVGLGHDLVGDGEPTGIAQRVRTLRASVARAAFGGET